MSNKVISKITGNTQIKLQVATDTKIEQRCSKCKELSANIKDAKDYIDFQATIMRLHVNSYS